MTRNQIIDVISDMNTSMQALVDIVNENEEWDEDDELPRKISNKAEYIITVLKEVL